MKATHEIGTASLAGADDPRVVQALEEYLAALEAGETPDRGAFLARYADVAGPLTECLAGLEFIRQAASGPGPAINPGAFTATIPAETRLGDYRIVREVGRGGMGIVYEAVQVSLGRRVALKVLPFAASLDAKQLQRFKHEAQAAAHLHHRHIVPVYGVGSAAGMHFYAMQFIDGQTVAALIAQLAGLRAADAGLDFAVDSAAGPVVDPQPTSPYPPPASGIAADTPLSAAAGLSTSCSTKDPAFFRVLAQLAMQAAEALEHAHQAGVIHRDIKPGNLLVDVQGNLWVTDFGLAHWHTQASLTLTGDLLGTLRYMSPEQVQGKRAVVDPRTDVYSLGATLYELLTLEPAVSGRDRQEVLRQISDVEPKPPRKINPAIPEELETIVLKAMAKAPAERYATAQELADDLSRFLKDEPIRARRPSLIQRARRWTRTHQPLVWSAAVCLIVASTAAAVSVGWVAGDRAAQQALWFQEVDFALQQAAELLEKGNSSEAAAWVRRAEVLLAGASGREDLQKRQRDLQADLNMLARLEAIRIGQSDVRDETFDVAQSDPDYSQAFRDYGIDVETLTPAEAVARIRERSIRLELALALDDWAYVRRDVRPVNSGWKRLTAIALAVDAENQVRSQLRQAWAKQPVDRPALERLAAPERLTDLPAPTLLLLGRSLMRSGARDQAVTALRKAQPRHPDDFWINHELAYQLMQMQPPRGREALPFYTAALALRPKSPGVRVNLSVIANEHLKDFEWGVALCREAIRLKPDYGTAHNNLGIALAGQDDLAGAVAAYQQALAINPRNAKAYNNLGNALALQRDFAGAVAAYEKALAIQPNYAKAYTNRGNARRDQNDLNGAIADYQKSISIDPNWAPVYVNLGMALRDQNDVAGATAAFQKAIAINPNHVWARLQVGITLRAQNDLDGAIAAFQTAIAIDPNFGNAYTNLGLALDARKDFSGALAAYQKGIAAYKTSLAQAPRRPELRYSLGITHYNLGNLLRNANRYVEAKAAFQEALAVQKALVADFPNKPDYHHGLAGTTTNLGNVVRDADKDLRAARELYEEASRHHQAALQADPRHPIYRQWYRNNRRLLQ